MSWQTIISLTFLFAATLAFELGFILLVVGILGRKKSRAVPDLVDVKPIDSEQNLAALAGIQEELAPVDPVSMPVQFTQTLTDEGVGELNEKTRLYY